MTGFAASVRTPAEGKIGADTVAWTQVIQGHSRGRQHGKRKRIGPVASIWLAGHPCNLGARRGRDRKILARRLFQFLMLL